MIRMFVEPRTGFFLLIVLAVVLGLLTVLEASDAGPGAAGSTYHLYGAWWFVGLLLLLFVNVLGVALRRRLWRKPTLLLLHMGVGLLLLGAFLSWRFSVRGMMYLSEGEEGNALYGSGEYWIELARENGPIRRFSLPPPSPGAEGVSVPLGDGFGTAEIMGFLPNSMVRNIARIREDGRGVQAVELALGFQEMLLAKGWREKLEVSGVSVSLGEPGPASIATPTLEVWREGELRSFDLDLHEDLGGTLKTEDLTITVLEYHPDFRVGQEADHTRPPRNPALKVAVRVAQASPETLWVFSRFSGFITPKSPGISEIEFHMPRMNLVTIFLYPHPRHDGWKYALFRGEESRAGALAAGDTLCLVTTPHGPASLMVTSLYKSADIAPQPVPAPEGPAALSLGLQGFEEPLWLIEDGPEVVVPDDQGEIGVLWLTSSFPLPFVVRLEHAVREDYPNSTIPRVYRSQLLLGEKPGHLAPPQWLATNAPLLYKGWRIYQSEYGQEDGVSWSGLQFARDPGAGLAGIGTLLVLVAFLVFALRALLRRAGPAALVLLLFPLASADARALEPALDRLMVSESGRIKPLLTLARDQEIALGIDFPGSPLHGFLGFALNPSAWAEKRLLPVDAVLARELGVEAGGKVSVADVALVKERLEELAMRHHGGDPESARTTDAAHALLGRANALLRLEELIAVAPMGANSAEWAPPTREECPEWARAHWARIKQYYRQGNVAAAAMEAEALVGAQRERLHGLLPSPFKVNLELFWFGLQPRTLLPWIVLAVLMVYLLVSMGRAPAWCGQLGLVFLVLFQSILLAIWVVVAGRLPLLNSWEVYFLVLFLIPLIGLVVAWTTHMRSIATVAVVMTFLGSVGQRFLPAYGSVIKPPVAILQSPWREIHILSTMTSYALLFLSAGLSFYVLLRPQIREARRATYFSLLWGEVLLGLGIATGAAWAYFAWGRFWGWDPKEVWALIAWLLYAASLHGRVFGILGNRGWAVLNLIGFAALLFTFFGVTFLLPGLHSYG